ncbi:MAG: zinc finger Ran-binding domain-containing protein [Spirochaetes bacterium]|nr:zinc finger Ran-binding domain-containing protein [Spirochaetota bacterium]
MVPNSESEETHDILDAVFFESYTRWGGARTLIVPCAEGRLDEGYLNWMALFDPDFVYSFVHLSDELVRIVDERCSPIVFMDNTKVRTIRPPEDVRERFPDWDLYIRPVSALSTIASPRARYRRWSIDSDTTLPAVAIDFGERRESRWFRDNFGAEFGRYSASNSISGLFETLCLVPDDVLDERIIVGTRRTTSVCEVVRLMAKREVMSIAMLASAHCESIPRIDRAAWSTGFNLIIGDSFLDRLLAWNARHFTPAYLEVPGSLRLSNDLAENEEMLSAVGAFLNSFDFLGQDRGGPFLFVRSSSRSSEDLLKIAGELKRHTYVNIFVPEAPLQDHVPSPEDIRRFAWQSSDKSTFRLSEDAATVTIRQPQHFSFMPPQFRFSEVCGGQWMVDLNVERHNSLSSVVNLSDTWQLPRKNAVVGAFTKNLGKVEHEGRLALVVTSDAGLFRTKENESYSVDIHLPTDREFFWMLVAGETRYDAYDFRKDIITSAYQNVSHSDKGQNLRGIVAMFDHVSDAAEILTNACWRRVLRDCQEKTTDSGDVFTLEDLVRDYVPKDPDTQARLMSELRLPNPTSVHSYLRRSLTDTLEALVNRGVFYRVYQWKCDYCGFLNSLAIENMASRNKCEICDSAHLLPISFEWKFKANSFVYRTLCERNGLPVIWAIGHLYSRNFGLHFYYQAETNLYRTRAAKSPDGEIDILAVVGGLFHVVEVKLTAESFVGKGDQVDAFVEKVSKIRPDVAMLAFESYCEPGGDAEKVKEDLKTALPLIKARMPSFTKLTLLVADDIPAFREYPSDLGVMGRRVWDFLDEHS